MVTIDKTAENFRLLYDVKGRFTVHRIMPEEAKVSLHFVLIFLTCMHMCMHTHTHTHTVQVG